MDTVVVIIGGGDDLPVLADQQELTYNSLVWTQDVAWKTYGERWVRRTNSERDSGKSVLAVRLDDIYIYIFPRKTHTHTHTHIYIYVCVCVCVSYEERKIENIIGKYFLSISLSFYIYIYIYISVCVCVFRLVNPIVKLLY